MYDLFVKPKTFIFSYSCLPVYPFYPFPLKPTFMKLDVLQCHTNKKLNSYRKFLKLSLAQWFNFKNFWSCIMLQIRRK